MGPSLLHFSVSMVLCTGDPDPEGTSQIQSVGESGLPSPAGCMLTDAAQYTVGLCCKVVLLFLGGLVQPPCFLQSGFLASQPLLYCCMGLLHAE